MQTLKFKIITLILMAGFGYILIPMFIDFLTPLYNDSSLLLSGNSLWMLPLFLMVISLWVYSTVKLMQAVYTHTRYGSVDEQKVKTLDKKLGSVDLFMGVAKKEFMKRRISKETFDDIQRIAGKEMVEIKTKKKELSPEKEDKVKKPDN